MGERRSRAGRLIGGVGALGVFLGVGLAPAAHADLDDLFAPFFDIASGADFATPAGAVLAPDNWLEDLSHPLQGLEQLFGGHDAAAPAAAGVSGSAADTTAETQELGPGQVHLDVTPSATDGGKPLGGGEPVVNASVGGGPETRFLLDTGSNGTVLPWWNFGWQDIDWKDIDPFNLLQFGSFAGGVGYIALQLPTTVDFGNGLVSHTPVDVELISFPISLQALIAGDWTLESMLGPANAPGIMGIGAPLSGQANISPVLGLEGPYNQGVLIDQQHNTLTFGEYKPESNDVTINTDSNSYSNLYVTIKDPDSATATDYGSVSSLIDSGGVFGTLPTHVFGGTAGYVLAPHSVVTVYSDADHTHELYTYTVSEQPTSSGKPLIDGPTFVSGDNAAMNTGNWLFQQNQVYVGYSGPDHHVSYTVIPTVEAGRQ